MLVFGKLGGNPCCVNFLLGIILQGVPYFAVPALGEIKDSIASAFF